MGIRIPDLLEGILEATAAEAAAKARIAALRAVLEDEARRRYEADGAAPTWKARDAGTVRYDEAGEWTAQVADASTFGSFVAQHYPTEATGVLRLPVDQLELALEALGFAGVNADTGLVTDVEVRPAWSGEFLKGLLVDVEEVYEVGAALPVERVFTVVDAATGQLVDGTTGTRSAAKLVVSLDRTRRAASIDEALDDAKALVESATTGEATGPSAEDIRAKRIELEGLHGDDLKAHARRLDLSSSGTKAELAERVARVALAKGITLVPASELPPRAPMLSDEELATARRFEEAPAADLDAEVRALAAEVADATGSTEARAIAEHGLEDEIVPVSTVAEPITAVDPATATIVEPYDDDRPGMMRVHVLEGHIKAVEALGSREHLRRVARSLDVGGGGTKRELATRLVEAGFKP